MLLGLALPVANVHLVADHKAEQLVSIPPILRALAQTFGGVTSTAVAAAAAPAAAPAAAAAAATAATAAAAAAVDIDTVTLRVRADFLATCFLMGNDYVPRLRHAATQQVWSAYKRLRGLGKRLVRGSEHLVNRYLVGESGELDLEFLAALLALVACRTDADDGDTQIEAGAAAVTDRDHDDEHDNEEDNDEIDSGAESDTELGLDDAVTETLTVTKVTAAGAVVAAVSGIATVATATATATATAATTAVASRAPRAA